jgi:hypothetical protein
MTKKDEVKSRRDDRGHHRDRDRHARERRDHRGGGDRDRRERDRAGDRTRDQHREDRGSRGQAAGSRYFDKDELEEESHRGGFGDEDKDM